VLIDNSQQKEVVRLDKAINKYKMHWYQEEEDEEELMFSPALLARRASESWIEAPPVEVLVRNKLMTWYELNEFSFSRACPST